MDFIRKHEKMPTYSGKIFNRKDHIMENKYKNLLSPFQIGTVKIKNRFCLAAMGMRNFDARGSITQEGMKYFTDFAKGGFGLIVSNSLITDTEIDGNLMVNRFSPNWNERNFVVSCRELTDRVHASGAKMFAQISLGTGRNGGFKSASENPAFFAPDTMVQALTVDEIHRKVEMEVEAALRCRKAGFDGLEIHAMHYGYLLDQFALSLTNHRTDEYGGCLENRLRVAREIVEGIKQVCGSKYPVMMRLGLKSYVTGLGKGHASLTGEEEAGRTLEEGIEICKLLESYGYDALDCDAGMYESWYHQTPPMYTPKGSYIHLAAAAKKAVNIPIILSNRMNDPDICEAAIAAGKLDGVSLGRAALADPAYPNKVAKGKIETIRPCLSCCQCIGAEMRIGGFYGCAVNPSVTREISYGIKKAAEPKKVLVVGGGVSGMEAALTAKRSGHEVVLCEASDKLGGNLIPASQHSFKQDMRMLNEWLQRELREKGVEIRFNTRVTPDMIVQMNPDVVLQAIGSTVIDPPIPGHDHPKYATCMDVLVGGRKVGDRVVIVGGGLTGVEMAIEYGMEGKKVTIVEALDDILSSGLPVPMMQDMMARDLLKHYGVEICAGYKITGVNDTGALVENMKDSTDKKEIAADTVVMAIGFRPRPSMEEALYGKGVEVHTIGDANRVGSVLTSIWDAYEAARDL